MKENHVIKRHPVRLLLLLITIAVLLLTALFLSIRIKESLHNKADNSAKQTISEITDILSHNINNEITSYITSLSSMASALNHIGSEPERMSFLKEMSLKNNRSVLCFAGKDGMMQTMENDEISDISSEDYFKHTIDGNATTGICKYSRFGTSFKKFVFAYPICKPHSDVPDGIICEFIDTQDFFSQLSLDINTIQIVLRNSDTFMTASTDYVTDTDQLMLPLDSIIDSTEVTMLLDKNQTSAKSSLILYSSGNSSQFIYRTALSKNWTLYTSLSQHIADFGTSSYALGTTLIAIFLIITIVIAIVVYIIPLMHEVSQQRVSESRSMLLANVSHELRTPLNTIIGISEIMARSELTDGQVREIAYISDAGKNLLAMINDLLDYTKLQSNKYEIIEDAYDLESLLYDMTTVATIRLNDKPVEFLVSISSYVPRHLVGDLLRVRQIINNIVTNAVKYTEKGYISVTIDCDFISQDDLDLIITVADTGIGIKKENINKLFDDFTRFDTTKNKNIEGSGLGMSIAMKFAQLMNGNIKVESTYGKGSTFTINITQHIKDDDLLIPSYTAKEPYENILILEKSSILGNYYSRCLEDTLVNYDITDDNYEFSSMFNDKQYDYVLADADTISMMRTEFPKNEENPVHFISLVHNNSSTLRDGDTLYIPLFPLQLYSYLNGQKRPEHNYSLTQSFIIHPMPEKRILVVDDNSMNLQVATGIMEPYHMQIDCACSGKEAVRMVQEKAYDLVFMDHMMPDMDGEETMLTIRKLNAFDCRTMPIIVLTANASSGAHDMFIGMGFQDFIPKPLEIRTLHALIYKWLKPENTEATVEYRPEAEEIDEDNYEDSGLIDFKEGLARIGSMPIYLKTLRNFCDTIPKKKEIISQSFPSDIKTFVIEVHGLKGVAAIVSANELTNLSLELEMMGKNENLKGIEPLLDDYYDYMMEVKMCAERFLDEHT